MITEFPTIKTIDDILPAIAGSEEFSIVDKGDFTYIDYRVNFTSTFPSVLEGSEQDKLYAMLRRECRGIKFHSDGTIAARPFHKFFNQGEQEAEHNRIDWDQDDILIMEKLDGSMIHPMRINNNIIWCTKAGPTDVANNAAQFTDANSGVDSNGPTRYVGLADVCINMNMTPIFEWCSRQNRIVLDYPQDQLILTACRDNHSGQYLTHTELVNLASIFDVPVVKVYDHVKNKGVFLKEIRDEQGTEGRVFSVNGQDRVKVKNEWYVLLHKSKERIQFEKDVFALVFENSIDDLLDFTTSEERDALIKFQDSVNHELIDIIDRAKELYNHAEEKFLDRKTVATVLLKDESMIIRNAVFAGLDGRDIDEFVKTVLVKGTKSSKRCQEVLYPLFSARWVDRNLDI